MSEPHVLVERDGAIRRLILNRPQRLNCLDRPMLIELDAALAEIALDDLVRVVVLTGSGRAFCTGQNLAEAGAAEDGAAIRATLERHYNPIIRQLRALEVPVVAAVNGFAAGAGCSLALACDIVVAAESAKFMQAFAGIGLVPDAGASYFLPRLVGTARAAGLTLLGETIDARKAEEWGLIWRSVPDAGFTEAVAELAARLAVGPTRALGLAKHALDAGAHHSLEAQLALEAELQAAAGDGEDFQEGRAAFLAKRKAKFSGR